MAETLINIMLFLVEIFFSLFIYAVLLRFFMQCARIDLHNPFCQLIISITNPLLKLLRRIVPEFWGIDFAALVLVYILVFLQLILIKILVGNTFHIAWEIVWFMVVIKIILNIISVCMMLIITHAIANFFNHRPHNPTIEVINQLTEWLLSKVRKFIPLTKGGIDFSLVLFLIMLVCLQMFFSSILNI